MLKDIFGFAEHQQKATYRLGYKSTLTRNSDISVLNKAIATIIRKLKVKSIEWYVPHYTTSISQQAILSKQSLSTTPRELKYVERSVFMKEVNTQNLWNFNLGIQEGINTPIWIIVDFEQKNRRDSQNLNDDAFYRPLVTSAQCVIGTENYPDSVILLNYDDDDYSKGYGQNKEAFRDRTKDGIF